MMSRIGFLLVLSAAALAAAPSLPREARVPADSETVIATYRARPGKEAELEKTIAVHWPLCRRLGLVLDRPHLILKGTDEAKKTVFIEILAWKDHDAPDNAPAELRGVWDRLQALVEPRLGHRGIEFPEVEVLSLDAGETAQR